MKLFKLIRTLLENVENEASYYMGGTLVFDLEPHNNYGGIEAGKNPGIMITRSGKGSTFGFKHNFNFVATDDIADTVKSIYNKYKVLDKKSREDGHYKDCTHPEHACTCQGIALHEAL